MLWQEHLDFAAAAAGTQWRWPSSLPGVNVCKSGAGYDILKLRVNVCKSGAGCDILKLNFEIW